MTEAVGRLAFDFCAETNRTSRLRLADALAQLQRDLTEGLEEGEVYARLTGRVLGIFADSRRAAAIGMTESSRAMHAGQHLMAQEASAEHGLTIRKKWLASSDACDHCQGLNGKVVDLDADFAVVGSGTYSRIPYPPFHPHCMCTWTEVLVL